jgi:hypothetical protein
MQKAVVLTAILFVVACSKKADKNAEPAATPPAGEATPAGSAAATGSAAGAEGGGADEAAAGDVEGAPPGSVLDCEKLVPKAMRDKYLAGARTERRIFECVFKPEGKDDVIGTAMAQCDDGVKVLKDGIVNNLKTNAGAHELAGVGELALAHEAAGQLHVAAWDNDSNCSVTMLLPKDVDPAAFTKDLLANLPIK